VVLGGAVYPGNHPTSAWSWVLIGLWFGGAPLVMLTVAAVYKLLGKEPESDEEES
jgi:hypothetical protein